MEVPANKGEEISPSLKSKARPSIVTSVLSEPTKSMCHQVRVLYIIIADVDTERNIRMEEMTSNQKGKVNSMGANTVRFRLQKCVQATSVGTVKNVKSFECKFWRSVEFS
ncbi:hypothetical protein CHS0354_019149 [Potamilus streckersoni]|uniref:Uncharacterized protein n=1 Tax=Potamilus streckersoni TaxID=2493646 RepID=A0AAE0T029_9BIVA|nr:hypothetical protein CHS0354_019149 [Potamilus streckersoni]